VALCIAVAAFKCLAQSDQQCARKPTPVCRVRDRPKRSFMAVAQLGPRQRKGPHSALCPDSFDKGVRAM
jgi:hypothetical protein